VLQYSGNLIAQHGHTDKVIPFAVNDPSGQWTIRIRDMLTGETQTRTLLLN
jgi:hypothetical protein